jgi:hypothetical protein
MSAKKVVEIGLYNGVPVSTTHDFFPDDSKVEGYQRVWLTKTGLIAVYFDADDRLQRKYFSTVHPMGPPTITDWLASTD